MRLSDAAREQLKHAAIELAGPDARLRLFGSRLDNSARGGDIDLLLELPRPAAKPAPLIARFSARASRIMEGRKVDVVLSAPNLKHQSIHEVALRDGVELYGESIVACIE